MTMEDYEQKMKDKIICIYLHEIWTTVTSLYWLALIFWKLDMLVEQIGVKITIILHFAMKS